MWFETTIDDPGEGQAEAALAAGAEMVIAAGGDGTVRVVCSELARTGCRSASFRSAPATCWRATWASR
jgi:diacylglycerol kinase family enzyme